MYIVDHRISKQELFASAEHFFEDYGMVKGVVDIRRCLLAVDADLHADLEEFLMADGSSQEDLWGINLLDDADEDDFIEFDSLINLRPKQGNRSRSVEDEHTRMMITEIVKQWIM